MKQTSDISKLFDAWNQALKTLDPDKVVALYAFNAILLPTLSKRVRHNHAEIREYFEKDFLPKKPSGTINESNIRVFNDVAINSGIYSFKLSNSSVPVQARYTFVYHWVGDRWLIVEHHSSGMPAKEEPSRRLAGRGEAGKEAPRQRRRRETGSA